MHGADPNARDEEGRLPFDHILENNDLRRIDVDP